MWNPFRTSARRDDEIDEIEPPPMSYFIINKYAASVAVIFFVIGWYCAYHYHNPTPPDKELPEQTASSLKLILEKPCVDTAVRLTETTMKLRCDDPRARADVKNEYHGDTFLVCSCH